MESAKIQEMLKKYPPKVLDSGNIRLPPARLSYPAVFEKTKPRGNIREEKFAATFLFPKGADLKTVANYFIQCGVEEGLSVEQMKVLARERIQEQAKKAAKGILGYEAGNYYLQAKSDFQPAVLGLNGKDITDSRAIYGGCWVIGLINAYKYTSPTTGMTWGLQSIVKIADDESFGGAPADPREELGDILDGTGDANALFGNSSGGASAEDSIFG